MADGATGVLKVESSASVLNLGLYFIKDDNMYQFTKFKDPENKFDNSDLVMTCDTIVLSELLENFENFLKGCGYIFEGSVQIIDTEE